MLRLITPLLIAATSLASPAVAGLHDYSGENRTSVELGRCYSTNDDSTVCYLNQGNGRYMIAINDSVDRTYPVALTVDCTTGQYNAFSIQTPERIASWVSVFCGERS
jgi:hypothetical protein